MASPGSKYNQHPKTDTMDIDVELEKIEKEIETLKANKSESEQTVELENLNKDTQQETVAQKRREDMERIREQIGVHYQKNGTMEKPEDNLVPVQGRKEDVLKTPEIYQTKIDEMQKMLKKDGIHKVIKEVEKTGDPYFIDLFHKQITSEHGTEL